MTASDFETPKKSSRDPEETRARLEAWIDAQLPSGSNAKLNELSTPSGTGMSSETLLFEANYTEGGETRTASLVGRLAPNADDCPVFPSYDLDSQFRLMQLVAEKSSVPVPSMRWIENDASTLGTPFFVMDRVEGRVPPDLPPYVFAGWVLDGTPEQRRALEKSTIGAMVELHRIDAGLAPFLEFDLPGDTPMRRHFENQKQFYEWVRADGKSHPILDQTFAWLEEHWPKEEGPTVISWGDSRIGNVLYDGWKPSALLDWEMAAPGPRELDLGWLAFMHLFFQNIAENAGMPGLPEFLQIQTLAGDYEEASGYAPQDLPFYMTYAALRHGIIMARIMRRMVHFGESEWTDDVDSVIPHRGLLENMLDGSFWK